MCIRDSSQTPPCRIPAAGSSSGPPCTRSSVHDSRSRQRILAQDFGETPPRQPSPACAATQPVPPYTKDSPIELPETAVVRSTSIVLVVAAEFGIQGFLLPVHRIMSVCPTPFGDRSQPSAEPFAYRPHMNCELPLPAASTGVCEPEEIEGLRFSSLSLRLPHRIAPKLN